MPRALLALAVATVVALLGCSTESQTEAQAPASAATAGPAARLSGADLSASLRKYEASLRRGAEWLLKQQEADGSFGGPAGVGKTGLVISALLGSPDADKLRQHPVVKKAVGYLLSMRQPDGSINTPGEKGLANYQTSAALSALCALNDPAHEEARNAARDFLLSIQNRDGTNFGSWGYNRDRRGDLSNTPFTLAALKAAGLDENSEAFKNCLVFLQRCQNRSESSDQPYSGDDGGAMYYPGRSSAGVIKLPNGRVIYKSYGSMTYALLRGYVLCGLKPDDPRVQAAQKWLAENYSVDENPGMENKFQGLYYYYLSMAKALALLGVPSVGPPKGPKRLWAKDLGDKLVALQGPEGIWINRAMRWQENDRIIATSFAMIALHECHAMLARGR